MSRTLARSLMLLCTPLLLTSCSTASTEPRMQASAKPERVEINCITASEECGTTETYGAPGYPFPIDADKTNYQPLEAAAYADQSTFQMSASQTVIAPSDTGWNSLDPGQSMAECYAGGYVPPNGSGRVNFTCPSGPCYSQWFNMRQANFDFTGKLNAFLLGGMMIRNGWGLFVITLPAGTLITGSYLNLQRSQRAMVQCLQDGGNWVFYMNDAPNPYVPGSPR